MSLLDTLRKNLDAELFAKVTDALGDDFNYDMVPRTRLNKVIAQRDEARQQLAATQSGTADDDDDDDSGVPADPKPAKQKKGSQDGVLTQADLDRALKAEREAGEAKVKELKLRFAATEKLRAANIVDPDLVLSSGLLDLTKVTTDESGAITGGLDDQILAITADRPYLVNGDQGASAQRGTGRNADDDVSAKVSSREDFLKLTTDQQIAFKKANPKVFEGFLNEF